MLFDSIISLVSTLSKIDIHASNTAMIFPFFVRFQNFCSKLKSIYLRCWEGQIKYHLPENVVFSVSDLPLYYEIPYDR